MEAGPAMSGAEMPARKRTLRLIYMELEMPDVSEPTNEHHHPESY
jgi:hypothetical protein